MTALMTEDEIVEAMMVAANDVINEDDTFHAGAMRAALAIALPWAREQALREAANVAGTLSETTFDNMPEFNAVLCVEAAIIALIPALPSQEP